jgi:uncharacterized RDD family membrane protein YckC
MICPHCAFPNNDGVTVCVKCRRSMASMGVNPPKANESARPDPVPSESAETEETETPEEILKQAIRKEESGDLRGAFLDVQALLIEQHGDLAEEALYQAYLLVGRVSLRQGKTERAGKYLQRAKLIRPNDDAVLELLRETTPKATESVSLQEPASISPESPPLQPVGIIHEIQPVLEKAQPVLEKAQPVFEKAQAAPETRRVVLAGFWIRTLAFFIDSLLVTVIVLIMIVLSSWVMGQGIGPAFQWFFVSLSNLLVLGMVLGLLLFVYLTVFGTVGGQSMGKMLLGLRVVRLDGHSLTTIQSVRRTAGMLLAALPGLSGFLWAAFDLHRRGWHDWIGGTLVIHTAFSRGGK